MEDQTNEPEITEEVEEVEETPEPTDDITELKSRLQRLEEKSITQRERTRILKQELEKARKAATPKEEKKTGEFDNADYALLSAKGYENDEELEFIRQRMVKWDMPLRQVLNDPEMKEKLSNMRIEREVKSATPSATNRTSPGILGTVEYSITKYDRTGELPDNFELRSAVINAKVERESTNKPPWQK